MRKLIWLILIFNSLDIKSQETTTDTISDLPTSRPKPYEIAYTFFGMNLKNELMFSNSNEPTFEFLNGILVRYKFNRFSLRLNASLSKIHNVKEYPSNCIDCSYGNAESKNYKIGIGGQFTPLKKKELIYSYFDLSYKSRKENGVIVDVKDTSFTFNNYHTKTNGLDFILGIGTKVKIYKNFYFTGEIGYNYYIAESKIKNRDIKTEQLSYQSVPISFQTILGKLYLSLMF